jgi:type IX secretion system PorP/SprF family membrane protein
MRKTVTILFIVLYSVIAKAQQIGAFSHSFYKPMVYNPAFAGSSGYGNATVISRAQWTGFKGSPQLNVFMLDGNLTNKNIGLGIGLISDKKGISNRIGGSLFYSYRLKINDDMHLRFGVSGGVINQTLNFSKVIVETNTDPTLFTNDQHQITYDANAGLAFIWKVLELGFSVPQIVGNKIKYKGDTTVGSTYAQARHYIGYVKYKFYMEENKGISIIPQAIVRIVPHTPIQYDGIINFDWNDKFWVGATYKSNYAVAANVGFCIRKHFYVGYSYDFAIGNIGKYSGMSHELMLNFKFGKGNTEADKEAKSAAEKEESNNVVEKDEPKPAVQKEAPLLPAAVIVAEDSLETRPALTDLTTLLLLNLIKEIETILDDPNATSIQILDLKNRISAFSNSEFANAAMKEKVNQYTSKLKLPSESSPDIIVKGTIILEGSSLPANYSSVTITVVDKKNEETVGTYSPNSKTGKYLLILRPDEKYQIIVENEEYQIHTEDLFFPANTENKEIIQVITLKK